MKAIVWTAYGSPDVLQLRDVEQPTPKDNEVLIRVHASSVTAGDCEVRNLVFPVWLALPMRLALGWNGPRGQATLGQEFSGEIAGLGKDVTRFQVGDAVFGTINLGVGLGAYAEYICLPAEPTETALALKPDNMSFEEAAAVPTGAMEALHFLRKADIKPGEKLLINGAGGSIGTYGLQLAKNYGAEITAVDSGEKLEMLRALGADHVVDYTQEDYTRRGETYDVIFDVIGRGSYLGGLRSLNENGRFLVANPRLWKLAVGLWTTATSSKKVMLQMSGQKSEDLTYLKGLIEAGKLTAVVDRVFPLGETAEAHHYVETGRKQGNVVIKVA